MRRRDSASLFVLIAFATLQNGWAAEEISGQVVHVTDGDTLVFVDERGKQEIVRIAAIDAPEKKHGNEPGQPFSDRSRAHLGKLVDGKWVKIMSDGRDDYERVVARVWVERMDVGLAQVCAGYAWVSERFVARFAQSDQQVYRDCQARAKKSKTGLWRASKPVPPWVWRHTRHARSTRTQ